VKHRIIVVVVASGLTLGGWSSVGAASAPASCTGHVASELAQAGELVAANEHLRNEARELGIPFGEFARTIAETHEGSFDGCFEAFVAE
jgi:hypothetical protein